VEWNCVARRDAGNVGLLLDDPERNLSVAGGLLKFVNQSLGNLSFAAALHHTEQQTTIARFVRPQKVLTIFVNQN